MKTWLGRLLPRSLFGRLLALLVVCVVASHVLALTLMFELRPAPGPRFDHRFDPPPGLPPELHLHGWIPTLASLSMPSPPVLERRLDGPFAHRPPGPAGGPPLGPPGWELLLDVAIRLAALILAAWIGARWFAHPMRRLAQAARALGEDLHGAPLAEAGPRECRETTRVFNQMQERIRQQMAERDQFVAAVSHDLRTPLTRLSLRIEQVERGARERLREDVREMEAMIASTLDYLRGEAEAEPFVALDAAALAQAIVDDEAEQGATIALAPFTGRAALLAQPIALRRALTNLVKNALRYGGSAELSVAVDEDSIQLEVADRGPGIPEQELSRVFAPFHRVESSRNRQSGGVGLGLSIVQSIARRHGGQIALAAREGGGLVARLTLPRLR